MSLVIRTPIGNFGCTGSLSNARQILTAAHCVTNGSNAVTANTVDVRFRGPSNTLSGHHHHPGERGVDDAAVQRARVRQQRPRGHHAAHRGAWLRNAADALQRPAGRGARRAGDVRRLRRRGHRPTGDQQSGYAFARRFGYNRFDATCNASGTTPANQNCTFQNNANSAIWTADFDNGGNLNAPVNGYNGNAICRTGKGARAPARRVVRRAPVTGAPAASRTVSVTSARRPSHGGNASRPGRGSAAGGGRLAVGGGGVGDRGRPSGRGRDGEGAEQAGERGQAAARGWVVVHGRGRSRGTTTADRC